MESIFAGMLSLHNACLAFIIKDHVRAVRRIRAIGDRNAESHAGISEWERAAASLRQQQQLGFRKFLARLILEQNHVKRSIWVKPRSSSFWDNDMYYHNDSDWISNFRMTRGTFCKLVELLYEEVAPASNCVREPVPVEKRIAVAVYKLASCAEYRTVGNLFGIHKSTMKKCVYIFCEAIKKTLFVELIKMPETDEAFVLAARNQQLTHLPMAIGFIDGSHIPILPPEDGRKDFINRKQYASIVLQAVVDMDGKFRNISCMVPGSAHDATVLKASSLYKYHTKFIPKGSTRIDGVDVPFYLIGDPAYPLMPWLLKAYMHTSNITPEQESYNVYLASARINVEMAFGRLKGRWRILLKRMDLNYKYAPNVIAVCCALHNFCESHRAQMPTDAEEVIASYNQLYPQPQQRASTTETSDGRDLREFLCKYLEERVPLRRSYFQ